PDGNPLVPLHSETSLLLRRQFLNHSSNSFHSLSTRPQTGFPTLFQTWSPPGSKTRSPTRPRTRAGNRIQTGSCTWSLTSSATSCCTSGRALRKTVNLLARRPGASPATHWQTQSRRARPAPPPPDVAPPPAAPHAHDPRESRMCLPHTRNSSRSP